MCIRDRCGNGSYSVVDNENVLYTHFGDNLYGCALADPGDPSAGIEVRYVLEDIITAIEGEDFPPDITRLFGLSMAYDGHPVSYTHLRGHETVLDLVCRLLLEKKQVSARVSYCRTPLAKRPS